MEVKKIRSIAMYYCTKDKSILERMSHVFNMQIVIQSNLFLQPVK